MDLTQNNCDDAAGIPSRRANASLENKFKILSNIYNTHAAWGEYDRSAKMHAALMTPGLTRIAIGVEHGGKKRKLVFTGDEINQLKRDMGYSPDGTILPQALKNAPGQLFDQAKGEIAKQIEEARQKDGRGAIKISSRIRS